MLYDAQEIHPGLWQGAWPPPGRWLADKGVSTLVLCALEYQPPRVYPDAVAMIAGMKDANPWPGVEVIYAPNNDDPIHPPPREVLQQSLQAGRILAQRLAQKRKVLSTCWQGRNRSGLVSAMALCFLLGIPGHQAALIVQRRRRGGLRNDLFVELLGRLRRLRNGSSA